MNNDLQAVWNEAIETGRTEAIRAWEQLWGMHPAPVLKWRMQIDAPKIWYATYECLEIRAIQKDNQTYFYSRPDAHFGWASIRDLLHLAQRVTSRERELQRVAMAEKWATKHEKKRWWQT